MATITSIKKAPRLALAAIKSFEGTDGYGLNADLYLDGKKVASVIDSGNGGGMCIQWFRAYASQEKIPVEVDAYITSLNLPALVFPETTMEQDLESLVNETVDLLQMDKKIKRQCKTCVLFRKQGQTEGEYYIIKRTLFTPAVKSHLLAQEPDIIEFINERF